MSQKPRRERTPEQRARDRAAIARWQAENPERVLEQRKRAWAKRKENWAAYLQQERERYARTRERKLAYQAEWIAQNPERRAAIARRAYLKRPHEAIANNAKRRAAKANATPSWTDLAAIKAIYAEARRISRETGVPHEVDHIIPLRGREVCGLHVPHNLQILPRRENRKKAWKVAHDDHQPWVQGADGFHAVPQKEG